MAFFYTYFQKGAHPMNLTENGKRQIKQCIEK